MSNNKNGVNSTISQQKAARILFEFLRKSNIKHFIKKEIEEDVLKLMFDNDGFPRISNEITKYYKYILGWGITELKRGKYISNDKASKTFVVHISEPKLLEPVDVANLKWKQYSMQTIFESIRDTEILIPDIQRPTAWTSEKNYVELAKSIFSWIPLGIMYFWTLDKQRASEIGHSYIKDQIVSGEELEYHRAKIANMPETVKSVIDGQQRLTALNIMMQGSFNGKIMYFDETKPEKMFKFYVEDKQPLNSKSLGTIFSKLKTLHESKKGKILKKDFALLSKEMYLSVESLQRLYNGIFKVEVLSICNIESASLDQITDIFIKVNENGKVLKPIDLMLTYLVSKDNSKKVKTNVIELLKTFKQMKKSIKYPTVMKLITMFFTGDSKSNYTTLINSDKYKKQAEWTKLKKATTRLAKLLKESKLEGSTIHSANSLIPVIIWMTKNTSIQNALEVNQNILLYIRFAQAFKYFKAGTDDKLKRLSNALNDDPLFIKWKLDDIIKSESDVRDEISKLNYNTDKFYIINILKVVGAYIEYNDDSVEHLSAQVNGGSQTLENLALLKSEANKSAGAYTIDEKVERLSKRYGLKPIEIRKQLLIDDKKDRMDTIASKLFNHFS